MRFHSNVWTFSTIEKTGIKLIINNQEKSSREGLCKPIRDFTKCEKPSTWGGKKASHMTNQPKSIPGNSIREDFEVVHLVCCYEKARRQRPGAQSVRTWAIRKVVSSFSTHVSTNWFLFLFLVRWENFGDTGANDWLNIPYRLIESFLMLSQIYTEREKK